MSNSDNKPYKHLPKKFEGIVEDTKYVEPQIDIKEEVAEYVDGVVNNASDEQDYLVKQFVESKVKLSLNEWQSKYRQNDEIIENIEEHIELNNKKIEKLEDEKKDYQKKIKNIKSEVVENEKVLEEIERTSPKPDINKKGTLIFLIIVSLGLAILTAYKFSLAMGEISNAVEGHELNWWQYIIYGFGAFAVLATGKILNTIYEKIHYNKKFFIATASLAIIFAAFSAYYIASDKAFLNNKAQIQVEINNLKEKIADVEPEPGEDISDEDKATLNKLKPELAQMEKKLKNSKGEAVALDKVMLILVLFTEMLIGGTTWMYATDYSRFLNEDKRVHSIDTIKQHIDKFIKEEGEINTKIAKLDEEIEHFRLENHDLHRVLANIKTEEEIEDVIALIIKDETNMALAHLWKKNG